MPGASTWLATSSPPSSSLWRDSLVTKSILQVAMCGSATWDTASVVYHVSHCRLLAVTGLLSSETVLLLRYFCLHPILHPTPPKIFLNKLPCVSSEHWKQGNSRRKECSRQERSSAASLHPTKRICLLTCCASIFCGQEPPP